MLSQNESLIFIRLAETLTSFPYPNLKYIYPKKIKKMHKNADFQDHEAFLDIQNTYIAASLDMLVSCDCCGDDLPEVKSFLVY